MATAPILKASRLQTCAKYGYHLRELIAASSIPQAVAIPLARRTNVMLVQQDAMPGTGKLSILTDAGLIRESVLSEPS